MRDLPLIKIHRDNQDLNQTLGSCKVYNHNLKLKFVSLSLERGWQNNQQNVSCIPAGVYTVKLEWSRAFQCMLWEIKNVENRNECKFHSANYWNQLKGCIALGDRVRQLNTDVYDDITNSNQTMLEFHKTLLDYNEALLIITTEPTLN